MSISQFPIVYFICFIYYFIYLTLLFNFSALFSSIYLGGIDLVWLFYDYLTYCSSLSTLIYFTHTYFYLLFSSPNFTNISLCNFSTNPFSTINSQQSKLEGIYYISLVMNLMMLVLMPIYQF